MRFIPQSKDFWAGILFLGFGVLALYIARNYTMGSAVRMGPGYFPTALGWILSFLGVVIGVRGLIASDDPIDRGALRPFLVIVAILAFALRARPAGAGGVDHPPHRHQRARRARVPLARDDRADRRAARRLDRRLRLGPRPPVQRVALVMMDLFDNLVLGFGVAMSLAEPALLLHRRACSAR